MSAAAVQASAAGTYVHWGVIAISLTNLIIIGVRLLVFALAVLPLFPGNRRGRTGLSGLVHLTASGDQRGVGRVRVPARLTPGRLSSS